MLHQILHITMAVRCFVVLAHNGTVLKQFCLFMAKSWPHLILQECTVILAIDHCTKWHGMVKQSLFWLKNMTCMTSEPPACIVQYSSTITLGYAIQHSVSSAEINASMTCQPLKCDRGMNCLHFSNTGGWWQEEHA